MIFRFILFLLLLLSLNSFGAVFGTDATSPYTNQGVSINVHLGTNSGQIYIPLTWVVILQATAVRNGYAALGWHGDYSTNRLLNWYINSNGSSYLEWRALGNSGGGYDSAYSSVAAYSKFTNGQINALVITVDSIVADNPCKAMNVSIGGLYLGSCANETDSGQETSYKTSNTAQLDLMDYDPTGAQGTGGITGTLYETCIYNRLITDGEYKEIVNTNTCRNVVVGRMMWSDFNPLPSGTTTNGMVAGSLTTPDLTGSYLVQYVNSPRIDGNINTGKQKRMKL